MYPGAPTGQLIQDHVEHLSREPLQEAAAGEALAAGHDGSGGSGPVPGPLVGLVCQRVAPHISAGFPHHHTELTVLNKITLFGWKVKETELDVSLTLALATGEAAMLG